MTDGIVDVAREVLREKATASSEERNYVSSVDEVPEGHEAHRGERDGIYWVGSEDAGGGSGGSSGGGGEESSDTGEPEGEPSDASEDDEGGEDDRDGDVEVDDEPSGAELVREADPEEFAENIETMVEENPEMGAFLSEHPPEELEDHALYTSSEGVAGIGVSEEGDIQNLHNHTGPPGIGSEFLERGIEDGGRTLDCYDGHLRELYADHGFREVGRIEFDPEYAPDGWNFEDYGEPDVVFMAYKPQAEDEYVDDYYEPSEWGEAKEDSREMAEWGDL